MPTASCAMCGREVDEAKLLFSDAGRICSNCELDLADQEAEANTSWTAAVGGPLMAFTAFIFMLTSFVPVIGLLAGAVAPLLAIVAIVLGGQAVYKAGEAEGPVRTLLVVCGAISIPSGLGVLVVSVLLVAVQLIALAGIR